MLSCCRFGPLLASRTYDPGLRVPDGKAGLLAGMAMTEKQGGSDVRANTTRAVPAGDGYQLTGHKWFCSAPMCDLFLVLAQAPEGLSCFLLPRVLPDGTRNSMRLQRLKDKLGNRSNASSEVEYDGAFAWLVYGDILRAAARGGFPSSAFCAYAAGVGVLLAQALLVRHIERDPVLRERIEESA